MTGWNGMRLMALAAVLLVGCVAVPAVPPAPSTVADATTLDEAAALKAERLYIATARVVLAADGFGLVPDAARAPIGRANRVAFAAVKAVRAAYDTGNADSYAVAATVADAAIANLLKAFRG